MQLFPYGDPTPTAVMDAIDPLSFPAVGFGASAAASGFWVTLRILRYVLTRSTGRAIPWRLGTFGQAVSWAYLGGLVLTLAAASMSGWLGSLCPNEPVYGPSAGEPLCADHGALADILRVILARPIYFFEAIWQTMAFGLTMNDAGVATRFLAVAATLAPPIVILARFWLVRRESRAGP